MEWRLESGLTRPEKLKTVSRGGGGGGEEVGKRSRWKGYAPLRRLLSNFPLKRTNGWNFDGSSSRRTTRRHSKFVKSFVSRDTKGIKEMVEFFVLANDS